MHHDDRVVSALRGEGTPGGVARIDRREASLARLVEDRDRIEMRLDRAGGAEVDGYRGRKRLPEFRGRAAAGARARSGQLAGDAEGGIHGIRAGLQHDLGPERRMLGAPCQ